MLSVNALLIPVADAAPPDRAPSEIYGDYAPLPSDRPDLKEFKKIAIQNQEDQKPKFTAYQIDAYPEYPYNITAADVDRDGRSELIVSKIVSSHDPKGYGAVDIYKPNGQQDLSSWTKIRIAKDIRFPNMVSAADIDGDRRLEFVIPYGSIVHDASFGGGIVWIEQDGHGVLPGPDPHPGPAPHPPAPGPNPGPGHDDGHGGNDGHIGSRKHVITASPRLMYRQAVLCDMNGDSLIDIVAVAETVGTFGDGDSIVQIFYGNKSQDRFEKTPVVVGKGAGGFPCVFDIDKDGDLDIASAEFYGTTGSFSWFENIGGNNWTKHYIDETAGKAFQLAIVPNLFNDGNFAAVGTNHTNILDNPYDRESALFVYEKPLNPRFSWPRVKVSSDFRPRQSSANAVVKQKAPGAFACGDIDGDRDIDIVVNGAGDPNVYLLAQSGFKKFSMSVLAAEMPHGGVALADFDGDGISDIVLSSAENNRLMIFKYNKNGQTPGF